MTKRFKYFPIDGPPVLAAHVVVIHKASGQSLDDVIEASAVAGWIRRQALDNLGNQEVDEDGNPIIERVDTDIEINAGPSYPKDRLDLNLEDDLRSGVVFDEDMTERDRTFCERAARTCPNRKRPMSRS
ncbi:MAG: hypothetical protein AAGA73_06575 [Pseudomonadota bacterium]